MGFPDAPILNFLACFFGTSQIISQFLASQPFYPFLITERIIVLSFWILLYHNMIDCYGINAVSATVAIFGADCTIYRELKYQGKLTFWSEIVTNLFSFMLFIADLHHNL